MKQSTLNKLLTNYFNSKTRKPRGSQRKKEPNKTEVCDAKHAQKQNFKESLNIVIQERANRKGTKGKALHKLAKRANRKSKESLG